MLSVIDWANFLNNPENKKDLLNLVCSNFQTDECRNLSVFPLIINSGENMKKLTQG